MDKIIEVQNEAVIAALTQVRGRIDNVSPVLKAIGEDVVERTKERFATATGPDGKRWAANAESTIINYLHKRGGFSSKTGKITAKGQKLAIGKRPLQGETGDLARQIVASTRDFGAMGTTLTVGSTMIYAAMQQFGGTKAKFPKLWGDIPARPFLPITSTGELYPGEADKIISRLQQYLLG